MEKFLLLNKNPDNRQQVLKEINLITKGTLMETLDIEFIDFKENYLVAKMPVNKKVFQPMGILHGGASGALLESVGSCLSALSIDLEKNEVRGTGFSINHLKKMSSGYIIATATFLHKGRTLHVCQVSIKNEAGDLIAFGKISNIILKK